MFPSSSFLAVGLLFLTVAFCQSVTETVDVPGNQTVQIVEKPRTICDIVRCPFGLICEAITALCLNPPCPKYRCVKHLTCLPKQVPLGCRVIGYKKDDKGCPDVDLDCVDQDREVLRKCRQLVDSGRWCGLTARRWYHDLNSGKCHEFIYGGCDGNDNNFNTKEECDQICDQVFPCTPVVAFKKLPPECHWETTIGPQFCPIPKIAC